MKRLMGAMTLLLAACLGPQNNVAGAGDTNAAGAVLAPGNYRFASFKDRIDIQIQGDLTFAQQEFSGERMNNRFSGTVLRDSAGYRFDYSKCETNDNLLGWVSYQCPMFMAQYVGSGTARSATVADGKIRLEYAKDARIYIFKPMAVTAP